MDPVSVRAYIERREERMNERKQARFAKAAAAIEPNSFYIEVNDWQPANLIAGWIDNKGYDMGFDGNAAKGSKYFYANGRWGCMGRGAVAVKQDGVVIPVEALKAVTLKEFIESDAYSYSSFIAGKEKNGYFDFGKDSHTITKTLDTNQSPLAIGEGISPEGFSNRCLIVNHSYDMEVIEHSGFRVLVFKRK
jgi:hypothetical protein